MTQRDFIQCLRSFLSGHRVRMKRAIELAGGGYEDRVSFGSEHQRHESELFGVHVDTEGNRWIVGLEIPADHRLVRYSDTNKLLSASGDIETIAGMGGQTAEDAWKHGCLVLVRP